MSVVPCMEGEPEEVETEQAVSCASEEHPLLTRVLLTFFQGTHESMVWDKGEVVKESGFLEGWSEKKKKQQGRLSCTQLTQVGTSPPHNVPEPARVLNQE